MITRDIPPQGYLSRRLTWTRATPIASPVSPMYVTISKQCLEDNSAPSLTDQVIDVAKELYDDARQKLDPAQIAQKDQLDAEYRDICQCLADFKSQQRTPNNVFEQPDAMILSSSDEIQESLAHIKASFGVSTKDFAEVLGVERQTIYAWLCDENVPTDANNRRICELTALAKQWNELCRLPAKKVLKIEIEETTLMQELCRVPHNKSRIDTILQRAAQIVNENEAKKQQKQRPEISLKCSEYDVLTLKAFIPQVGE